MTLTMEPTMTNLPDYLNPARIQARGDVPMSAVEKLDEFTFLTGLGVSYRTAAEQLGETLNELSYLSYLHGRPDMGRHIENADTFDDERDRNE